MRLSRTLAVAVLATVALSFVGCSCDPDPAGTQDSSFEDAALATPDVGPRRDAFGASDCLGEAITRVYLLTTDLGSTEHESHLLQFDPETLAYTDLGRIDCDIGTQILRSMAVDRDGTAWVSTSRGELYTVDTTTIACRPTGMATDQEQVRNYGMGFATIGSSSDEELYITAEGGWWMDGVAYRRLGVIDRTTLTLTLLGDIDAPTPANMELTGTGDGRLFGMVLDVRNLRNIIVSVELLDASDAHTIERRVVPLTPRGGFAFAQWGGDFWLFTEAPDGSARVAQFDWDESAVVQTVDTPLTVPGTIVGAGVSTCAPYDLI